MKKTPDPFSELPRADTRRQLHEAVADVLDTPAGQLLFMWQLRQLGIGRGPDGSAESLALYGHGRQLLRLAMETRPKIAADFLFRLYQ